MRQVTPPDRLVHKILGEQKENKGAPYRLTAHCMRAERPEGVLLFHALTGELLLLSHEEAALLGELPGPVPPALKELMSRWFLRPVGTDDMALADQVRSIWDRFMKKDTGHLTGYTIFTTMDCNARCFYCFEAGWERSSMTEETARATAAYIAAHCGGKKVRLRWFGGEPLVNVKAIDLITGSLREQGVAFRSSMTTNGYLFDETMVRRAKEDWDLRQVQITLDGTEEIYNARKAYVHPQGSPFQRVLGNIGLLLDAGISVSVRLNMDGENARDLYALIDQLAGRFGGREGFSVYLAVIRASDGVSRLGNTEERFRSCAQEYRALLAHVEQRGLAFQPRLKRRFSAYACQADNPGATTVLPDGSLGRCENRKDDGVWGSVWSEDRDEEVLRPWRERRPPEPACRDCFIYPQCFNLKKCPGLPEHCTPVERTRWEDRVSQSVLRAYEEWRAAGQS